MTETNTYHLLGNLLRFHARGEAGYCLIEATTAPGAGAPPNSHPGDEEVFYVREGRFAFTIEGRERIAGAGDVVTIPTGAVHAFTNVGDTPGKMLIFNVPGRMHAGFFPEAGDPLPADTTELPPPAGTPPDVPRLVEIAKRHGIAFHL